MHDALLPPGQRAVVAALRQRIEERILRRFALDR
jgi:hypothetical protein